MEHHSERGFNLTILGLVGLVVVLCVDSVCLPRVEAQTTVSRPQFEVASIRPCNPDGGGRGGPTPGRFNPVCATVESLIRMASDPARQLFNVNSLDPIKNVPNWAKSERYTINAKAPDGTEPGVMRGPMLMALLEDRFKLRFHRETSDVPVYNLTVGKGGLKLQPRDPASCVASAGQRVAKPCGGLSVVMGALSTIEFFGTTFPDLAKSLRNVLDRPVIDRTGLVEIFDVRVQFSPDPPAGASPAAFTGPSVFTALEEQVGLRLESTRGPHELVVIDNVERPSEN